jgi:hypothetical protein
LHNIEPYYNWQHLYNSETDEHSPYYGEVHSEFQYTNTVFNYYVHPQWDSFGSENLYLRVIFVDYDEHYAIIEFIGEWNDVILNDSSILKRNLIDTLISQGIYKYILITENVLSLFTGDTDYYDEWISEIIDEYGFIAFLNLNVLCDYEWQQGKIKRCAQRVEVPNWRTCKPEEVLQRVEEQL